MKARKIFLLPFIILLSAAALCAAFRAARGENKVLFIAPTFNIQGAGISIDGIRTIGENLIRVIEKRLGISIEYEMVGSPDIGQDEALDLAVERLRKSGDFSWTDYPRYLKMKEQNIPMEIVALAEADGNVMMNNCIYVLNESGFKTINDLRGKRANGGPNIDWVGMRLILYEKGIDEPPDKFFGELIPMSTFFAALNGLLLNRIDTFALAEPVFNVLKGGNPNYAKIKPLACSKSSPNTLIPIYRKNLDEKIVDTFRSILLNCDKDPDMAVVRPFIQAAKIRFVLPEAATVAEIDKRYKLVVGKGWIAEQKKYLAEYQKTALKKAAKKCKKNCAGGTAEEIKACIAKCDKKSGSKD